MSHNRNLDYLIKRRIIYRRSPITDKPTESFEWGDYYENGTYECYHLFRSKAKITTYKSLKWHYLVLYYLNPNIPMTGFFKFISNKENGFVTFFISDKKLDEMINDVIRYGGEAPVNKIRKIIFKDYSGLTPNEKMSIVGKLVGRSSRVDEEAIYQCMLDLSHDGKNITWSRIASLLDCSTRTVQRNLTKQLRDEKEILNE